MNSTAYPKMNMLAPHEMAGIPRHTLHKMQVYEERIMFDIMKGHIPGMITVADQKDFVLESIADCPDRKRVLHRGRLIGWLDRVFEIQKFICVIFELEFEAVEEVMI
jgi:hypothetical protein